MALSRSVNSVRKYILRNPARVYSLGAALATFVARLHPDIPIEFFVLIALTLLGVGNRVQKIEDQKTLKALYMTPPRKRPSKNRKSDSAGTSVHSVSFSDTNSQAKSPKES